MSSDYVMDIFAKHNEDARRRSASPECEPTEPPGVHDPAQPRSIAIRRRQSSPLVKSEAAAAAAATQATNTGGGRDLDSVAHTLRTSDGAMVDTPTTTYIPDRLENDAPRLVPLFDKFVGNRDKLAQGWYEQYNWLAREEEERAKELWRLDGEEAASVVQAQKNREEAKQQDNSGESQQEVSRHDRANLLSGSVDEEDSRGTVVEEQQADADDLDFSVSMPGSMPGSFSYNDGLNVFSPDRWAPATLDQCTRKADDEAINLTEHLFSPDKSLKTPGLQRSSRKSDVALELRIKLRLLPAMVLLSQTPADVKTIQKASSHARAAWKLANRTKASASLVARCCFYVGVCRYLLHQNDTGDHRASTWFSHALDAEAAGYEEGKLAREWMERLESERETPQTSPRTDMRPASAGSWVSGVWKSIQGWRGEGSKDEVKRAPLADGVRGGSAEASSEQAPRRGQGEAIPDFESEPSTASPSQTRSVRRDENGDFDHHGLKWSPGHPFGKGEILPTTSERTAVTFQTLQSPDSLAALSDDDADEEGDIPHNVRGGLVPITELRTPRSAGFTKTEHSILRIVKGEGSSVSSSTPSAFPAEATDCLPSADIQSNHTSRRKSVTSPSKNDDTTIDSESLMSPLKGKSLLDRRRLASNVLAITTGRAPEPTDPLVLCEEGRSPSKPSPREEGLYRVKREKTPQSS